MAIEFRPGFAAVVQIDVAALCGLVARTKELRASAGPDRLPAAEEKLSARSARRGSTQPALLVPNAANESASGRSTGPPLKAYPVIEA